MTYRLILILSLLFLSFDASADEASYAIEENGCSCGCSSGDSCSCARNARALAWRHEHHHANTLHAFTHGCRGVWFPEDPPLFRPPIADPRQLNYSVGWRFDDSVVAKNVIPISFYDSLILYRFCDVGSCHGQLDISIDGGLWGVFSPLHEDTPLVNTDYYVGVPVCYSFGCWAFRLRVFHVSSHLGDEFLVLNPDFDRRNPSAEYADFFVSYQLTPDIRVYGGAGWLVAQDETFRCGSWYAEGGAEVKLQGYRYVSCKDMLYGLPFLAIHYRQKPEFKRHIDMTYMAGYEIGKLCGLCRNIRAYVQYHDGYSLEGQFCREPTNYFGIGLSHGY